MNEDSLKLLLYNIYLLHWKYLSYKIFIYCFSFYIKIDNKK